jgi:amino acid transporter
MALADTEVGLQKGTNWWGAFVIGLAGTILVTGIAPLAVQGLGAGSIPLFVIITAAGVLLCFCLAELAAMMPDRTGGLPSYADVTFRPLGDTFAKHMGGVSGWAYWLGWFPVAPINAIIAANYVVALLGLPTGREFAPISTPITLTVLLIAEAAILLLFVPSILGIRLGAGFATLLGVVSMVPLTLLVVLPVFRSSGLDFSRVSGFALPEGVTPSVTLYASWIFVMTWSVLAMEAAACYIGECRDPVRDSKIALTAEGLYGFFIYVLTPVMFVAAFGVAESFDPLTVYTAFTEKVFGSGSFVNWLVGLPLIVALLLSVLNAIMGVGRSLYQISEDGLIPKWFGALNRNGVPARAMGFNVICSMLVVLFGSPAEIYVFSNMGYLLACSLALVGYAVYRIRRPELARPVRMPNFVAPLALVVGLTFLVIWLYGGYFAADVLLGDPGKRWLFFLGLFVVALYLPLYWWRRSNDQKAA